MTEAVICPICKTNMQSCATYVADDRLISIHDGTCVVWDKGGFKTEDGKIYKFWLLKSYEATVSMPKRMKK